MAIDFPDSPTENQQYTVGDRTWTWNGTYWELSTSTSTFTASDTEPVDPDPGDIWFDSTIGKTFVNYNGTWVEIGNAATVVDVIADADADTKIQVEVSADSDKIEFTTAGTKRLEIDASGHIIPAANETYDLGSASARFRDIYLSGASIDLGGATISSDGTNLTMPPVSNISGDFTVGTDVLHVDHANSRVGIGTTSPSHELDVTGTVNATSYVRVGGEAGLVLSGNTIQVGSAASGKSLSLNAGATNRVFINSSGNVGIGTTSPSQPLQAVGVFDDSSGAIQDTGTGEMLLADHTGGGNPVAFALRNSTSTADTTGNYGILHLDRNGNGVGGGSNLHFRRQNSADEWIEYGGVGAQIVDNTDGSEDGQLNFYTTNNGGTRNLRMYITPEGYVRNPTIPAWHVGLSSDTAFSSGVSPIAWNQSSGDDLYINGVSLNTSNGRITVPVTGYYFVMVYLRTEAAVGGSGQNLYLRRNGGGFIQRWYQDTATVSNYQHFGPLVATRYMVANDFFDVAYDPKGSVSLSAYTNGVCGFSGYLLG